MDKQKPKTNFDPSNDGVDRCSAFLNAFVALLKEHRVMIKAKFQNLELVKFHHEGEGPDTNYEIDMQDIHFLAN